MFILIHSMYVRPLLSLLKYVVIGVVITVNLGDKEEFTLYVVEDNFTPGKYS